VCSSRSANQGVEEMQDEIKRAVCSSRSANQGVEEMQDEASQKIKGRVEELPAHMQRMEWTLGAVEGHARAQNADMPSVLTTLSQVNTWRARRVLPIYS